MNALSVKVYLLEGQKVKEIRRFSIEEDVCTSFEYLDGKIRTVLPELLRKDLRIMWKDADNECVTISSDEELNIAVHSVPTSEDALKVYVKAKNVPSPDDPEQTEHPGVSCDGCDAGIKGYRYKCISCYDYDLCTSCHLKGTHAEHDMMCIKRPRSPQVHVFSMPPWRGRHRGAPWCGGRRGMGHRGPWGNRGSCGPSKCGDKKDQADAKEKRSEEDCSQQGCEQVVGDMAAAFGLDPEVAVSTAKSMIEDFKKHCEEAQKNTTDENMETSHSKPDEKQQEKASAEQSATQGNTTEDSQSQSANADDALKGVESMVQEFASQLGLDPQNLTQVANGLASNILQQFPPASQATSASTDEPMQTGDNESKSGAQSAFNPDPNHPYSALGGLMSQLFQGFAQPQSSGNSSSKSTSADKPEPAKTPEDFVVVSDSAEGSPRSDSDEAQQQKSSSNESEANSTEPTVELTEEHRFHQRLDTAIKQMEAMGFKDEGGWLTQLLIAKQLNISAVLDALNPQ